MAPLAAVMGCEGHHLTPDETAFFRDADPLGFILFARNIDTPEQVRGLVAEFRAAVDREDAPVLIDQEGGRVQRLRPPHWRDAPPAVRFAELAQHDLHTALEATRLNARLMGEDLYELGITVDCAPVLDVPQPGADPVIGDRAYGTEVATIAALGRAVCEGLLASGVVPVIKHIPGHGRASVDSHKALPVVETGADELGQSDFEPFRLLADMPWAMTAHVLFTDLDAERPATTSPNVIADVIRGHIGFDGVLVSDDLSMQALGGDMRGRTEAALAAGCDVALHCNGNMAEMKAVAEGGSELSTAAWNRIVRGDELRRQSRDKNFERGITLAHLDALLSIGGG